MEDQTMFSTIAKCFTFVEEDEWKTLTKSPHWQDFLASVRRALQDEECFGRSCSAIQLAGRQCPLQEFISAGEVRALFAPLSFEEKQRFAARHFVGGLPESAMPVESLYAQWSEVLLDRKLSQTETGHYYGPSACYMKDLIARLGMEVPAEFTACPDHLALELDLVAVLIRSGMEKEARLFLAERFKWLTAYRMRLLALEDENTRFYIGLIDVLMGIVIRQSTQAFEIDFSQV